MVFSRALSFVSLLPVFKKQIGQEAQQNRGICQGHKNAEHNKELLPLLENTMVVCVEDVDPTKGLGHIRSATSHGLGYISDKRYTYCDTIKQ